MLSAMACSKLFSYCNDEPISLKNVDLYSVNVHEYILFCMLCLYAVILKLMVVLILLWLLELQLEYRLYIL